MICSIDNTEKSEIVRAWKLNTWRVGQQFLFLMIGSRKLGCWTTGQGRGADSHLHSFQIFVA